MPRHNFAPLRGRVVELEIDSRALVCNRLGDPSRRRVAVYLSPGYDPAGARVPLLVGLAAFGGSGLKQLNWSGFGENLPQRIDRLIDAGVMGPVALALPDGFTSMGGNQWIDTPVLGNWEGFVLDELLPRLEAEFHIAPGPAHRGVFGHSSGGYAALIHAMKHGERWGAAASHSGDVGFELVYGRELPKALAALEACDHDPARFFAELWAAPRIGGRSFDAMMLLAMAASYAPEDDAPLGVRLPVDRETCARDPKRWARWLAHDPLELGRRADCQASIRHLRGLYIDCGAHDEYFVHYGTRALVRELAVAGVEHVYEEFDGGHSGVSHRLDVSLPFLYRALAADLA